MMDPVQVREQHTTTATAPGSVTTEPDIVTRHTVSAVPVGYRAINLVWLIAGIVNTILAFDVLFRIAGANDVGFGAFVYNLGGSLAAPFDDIFGNSRTQATGSLVRWSDLIAMAVYTLVAYLVVKAVKIAALTEADRSV